MKKLLPLFILLSACAPSEEKFDEESIQITCDLIFECTDAETMQAAKDMDIWFYGEDAAECVSFFSELEDALSDTGTTTEYVYDKKAAKECLTELKALTCDDFNSEESSASACDNVYTQ